MAPHVLLVTDDAEHGARLSRELRERGFDVTWAGPDAAPLAPPPQARPRDAFPTLAELERRHILAVLDAVRGNKSYAAQILGVDRRTLYRKLAAYGVGEPGQEA